MTSSPEGRQEAAVALLPCPFCGGKFVAQGASGGYISVWCGCGARGPDVKFPENCDPLPPIHECYAAWNRRALPAPVAAAPVGVSDAMVETVAAKFMASQHGVDLLGYPEGTYRDGIMYSMRAALEAALIAPAKPAVELVEALQRLRAVGADCARHNNEKAQADIEECCGDIEAALQAPATPDALPASKEAEAVTTMAHEAWLELSCDEQFALATRIAGNIGYNLIPETEEIDPFPSKARDPGLQACIDAASKAFRETFAAAHPPTDAGVSEAMVEAALTAYYGGNGEVLGHLRSDMRRALRAALSQNGDRK